MANIINYVEYYGNKNFDEIPFNDVDALVFAEFSYLHLEDFVKGKLPMTIHELAEIYFEKITKEEIKNRIRIYREVYALFEAMKDTVRYQDIVISNYKNIVDEEKQFGAITFRNKRKWVYVSFEGTDDSIIGWKEDFDLSHTFPVPSQKMAMEYLENEVKFFDKTVYVGGHSKGGNLSLVASMYSSSFVRHRLKNIYIFDGPGLREEEYHSLNYHRIQSKIKMFVPEESIVGMMLCHDLNYTVVKSTTKGAWQHDGFSWECFGSMFVPGLLSKKSMTFSKEIVSFLRSIPDDERVEFVEAIFLVFKKAEITSTENITFSKLVKALGCIGDLTADKKIKDKLKKILSIIITVFNS